MGDSVYPIVYVIGYRIDLKATKCGKLTEENWQLAGILTHSLKVVPPNNEVHCSFLSQADFQPKTYHYDVQSVYHIEVASN